ncbi:Protein hgh1 [Tilletia horrida]|uniref:Protein hgh1 n=1 Tax=Tilletia horrida TaxID=155126 RepID=A0AAN6JRW9_9BASI|nr:Protein hgh1 [Tilletia horrida]
MSTAELELLTFLSDPDNASVRQLALEHVVGWTQPGLLKERALLIAQPGSLKTPGNSSAVLKGRDGKPLDTIRDLKALCRDQPLSAHHAFSALINLSDSALVARRIADEDFLAFLVQYLADPISLLADLACMLLSNLTKVEAVSSMLLDLQVPARSYYAFHAASASSSSGTSAASAPQPAQLDVPEAEPPSSSSSGPKVAAMRKLLTAFDEGAAVASNKGTADASSLEAMKARVLEVAKEAATSAQAEEDAGQGGASKRPFVARKTNCNFLASVFANATVLPKGREFFITPSPASASSSATAYPVSRIAAYTEHPDLIRRGGVISAIKNILFVKSAHALLLAPPETSSSTPDKVRGAPFPSTRPEPYTSTFAEAIESTDVLDILPSLLLPLISGAELAEVDLEDQESLPTECQLVDEEKERERDPALRLMLVECLLLFCTSLYGRQVLRCRGAYVVVREAHVREKDEKISESIHRLVDLIQRDESDATINDSEGGQVDIGAVDVGEEDDDDMVIEEL